MVCEFPQWGFIHKHARGTLVIHRGILGSHGGRSHVIVGLSTFAGHTRERGEGESLSVQADRFRPSRARTNDFGTETGGGVMTTRLVAIAAMAVLTAVALVGCNDGDATLTGSPTTQSATTTGASPSSTPTPTKSLTPADQDLAAAEQSVTDYWRVLDSAASDPKSNLNALATVARGQALAQWQTTLATDRGRGLTQVGTSKVRDATATRTKKNTFRVSACLDVSDVDVVDQAGKSVVSPTRPDAQRYTYTVEKAPQGFFVTEDLLRGESCAA